MPNNKFDVVCEYEWKPEQMELYCYNANIPFYIGTTLANALALIFPDSWKEIYNITSNNSFRYIKWNGVQIKKTLYDTLILSFNLGKEGQPMKKEW